MRPLRFVLVVLLFMVTIRAAWADSSNSVPTVTPTAKIDVATSVPSEPPTQTPEPSSTVALPTATSVPPTATSVPAPTEVPEATATPVTPTPDLPTATVVPPTPTVAFSPSAVPSPSAPSATVLPSPPATATATATVVAIGDDECEGAEPCGAAMGQCRNYTFAPTGDEDTTAFTAEPGVGYRLYTQDLSDGVDTRMAMYDDGVRLIGDDDGGNGKASYVEWVPTVSGVLTVHVINAGTAWGANAEYELCVETYTLATATIPATATAQPTVPVPATATVAPTPRATPTALPAFVPANQGGGRVTTPRPVTPSGATSSESQGAAGTTGSMGDEASLPVAPSTGSSTAIGTLSLLVYVDYDGDGLMYPQEEGATGVVATIYAYKAGARYEQTLLVREGAAGADTSSLPNGAAYLLVTYLHRSARVTLNPGQEQQVVIALPATVLPIELP